MKNIPVLLVSVLLATGCASIGKPNLSENHRYIVAKDFVNALEMLDGAEPRSTTIQTSPTDSRFGKQLVEEMKSRGYGIQLVKKGNEQGPMYVSYTAERFEDSNNTSVVYRVRVGATEMGREYEIRGDQIFPITALSVIGIAASRETLDNSIFKKPETLVADVNANYKATTNVQSEQWQPITSSQSILIGESREEPLSGMLLAPPQNNSNSAVQINPSQIRKFGKKNVRELGKSNYEEVFTDYTKYKETTLVFGDDSLVFGKRNKDALRVFMDDYNANTDIVSILGCSNGKTNIDNGNEYLAIGRANRVKEALIIANIPVEQVFHEGCWAGDSNESLPPRGVLVSIHRAKANS